MLEERVLNALRCHLMDPKLFKEFCDEFTREMNRLRMEGSASIEAARAEVMRIERELDTLLNLILKGGAADRINAKMVQLEGRKAELERQLADAESATCRCSTPKWRRTTASRSAPSTRPYKTLPRQPGSRRARSYGRL